MLSTSLFAFLMVHSFNVIVGSVYTPPHSPLSINESHITSIKLTPNSTSIISLLFLVTTICPKYLGLMMTVAQSTLICQQREHSVPKTFATNGFFQVNNVHNSCGSVLDLVFCSHKKVSIDKSHEPLLPFSQQYLIYYLYTHYYFIFLNICHDLLFKCLSPYHRLYY